MCACMRTCVIGREGKEGRDGISHCLDRGLLDARGKVLEGSVAHVPVVAVVGAVLVVVSELKAKDVVHELDRDVVAEEDDIVASSGIGPQVRLGRLREAGVTDERGPHEAVDRLIPEHRADSSVVERGEEAHLRLVVVLANLLRNEPRLMLVIDSKPRIHVDLVHESCEERAGAGIE